MNTKHIL